MHSLLAYIIQVNILFAIVYIGYFVLLKKLTFYQLNRGYFLIGAVFCFVYPFLDIKSLFRQHIEPIGEWMAYLPDVYTQQVEKSVYTLENAIYSCIGIIGLWVGTRLCIRLLSLWRIHLHSQKAIWKTYWYQHVLFPIVPFSFLNKIYLHKEQHQESELYDIFEHEGIHVKGLHSVDILMFEILLIVCWYNPFVWLMRRAVRQNLEYLTDQQVLDKGMDRQAYQYSLLQVSKQGASLGLSNQFNFKFLKKRIMMMNKKKSSKLELSKYAFLLPIVIFSAGAFTISKADGKIIQSVEVVRDIKLDPIKTQDVSKNETKVIDTTKTEQDTIRKKEVKDVDEKKEDKRGELHRVDIFGRKASSSGPIWDLNSKSEIDQSKDYVYKYDGKAISKEEFIQMSDDQLYGITFTSKELMKREYPDKDGVISAWSKEEHDKQTEQRKKVLYVIDNVEQPEGKAALDALNPNQIDSITVLKDASATGRYGDRGQYGVIIIKTKRKDKENNAGVGDPDNHKLLFENEQVLQSFLDKNKDNIDLKGDHILIINGKIAKESDLKKLNSREIVSVGALDLTKRNSNLPSNVIGILYINSGANRSMNGAEAWVLSAGKKIGILNYPDKSSSPYIERN